MFSKSEHADGTLGIGGGYNDNYETSGPRPAVKIYRREENQTAFSQQALFGCPEAPLCPPIMTLPSYVKNAYFWLGIAALPNSKETKSEISSPIVALFFSSLHFTTF